VNPPDDQDALVTLDVACDLRGEPSAACVDLTRFQRASKRTEHSAGRRSDDVIESRRVRLCQGRGIDLVVLGNRSMHAERDWLRLAGEMGDPKRSLDAFDADLRGVGDIRHGTILQFTWLDRSSAEKQFVAVRREET